MNITDNTILITGGTSGIGRALAEAFHKRGNRVIIAGRRQTLLDEVTNANPGMHGMRLDIEDAAALADFAESVRERFPALNVLISNAGIMRAEDLKSDPVDLETAESTIQTNILGVLRLTTALLPPLKSQPRAAIITTTSGLAFAPRAEFPTYCASKAFLHSWIQSLRFQMRKTSVEILELAPPYVQTELVNSAQAVDPAAMPLADYISEAMNLLETSNTPNGEILVERVKAQRFAERKGIYGELFNKLNSG